MRKLILNWLFGEENVEEYIEVLGKAVDLSNRQIELRCDYLKSLEREKEYINIIIKFIELCEKHGIPISDELKHIPQ